MRSGVLNAVRRAREFYGELDIMVTGHSMGGVMASFCGLDLTVNFCTSLFLLNVLLMLFIDLKILGSGMNVLGSCIF